MRCLVHLMATDPGDLVLDPTCGSGTTAYVAEQWGRRWITIDTSRVALALARARIMGARYPYYLLADSREGQIKEAEVTRTRPRASPRAGNIRHGFVYERVPHITLKSIANNAEIDVIWDKWQAKLEPLREQLNAALRQELAGMGDPPRGRREVARGGEEAPRRLVAARIARQQEIDASIAAKAEFEYLYDKPYEDKKKVRVAGPFTVESLSPHRVLGVDENDELIDPLKEEAERAYGERADFVQMILENLKTAGVQQAHKEDKIVFTALVRPWPGDLVCAEGALCQGRARVPRSARPSSSAPSSAPSPAPTWWKPPARPATPASTCSSPAPSTTTPTPPSSQARPHPVLKARMNADLHMAEDLKNTGKGNLFVIFGEPDIDILDAGRQVR
jgi:adenine-specific DNA-methyltransferase